MPHYLPEDEIERRARERALELSDERIARMPDAEWHLDKKVPIAMIVAFFVQTVTLVYVGSTWKAETESRLQQLEKVDVTRETHESRIIVMEQGLAYIRSDLAEIKTLLKEKAK